MIIIYWNDIERRHTYRLSRGQVRRFFAFFKRLHDRLT